MGTKVNHVGLCVTDVSRSRRFYEGALGFAFDRELRPPDDLTGKLLGIEPPVGLLAVYLTLGVFVLELLCFERPDNPAAPTRPLNEPGLTHLSLSTDDLAATVAAVIEHGGSVVESSDIGLAVMVRDPDGQLVELLPARHA